LSVRTKPASSSKESRGMHAAVVGLPSTRKEQSHDEEHHVVSFGDENREVEKPVQQHMPWLAKGIPHRSLDGNLETNKTLYPSQDSKTERPTLDTSNEENKSSIIDAHNLFEPPYLSRPPPLRVDISAFDYDPEQDSPTNQGPMSYSAVLKVKNEESSPEAQSRSIPVKLTSLTKTSESVKDQITNKHQLAKNAAKEMIKESSGSRRDQTSGPRPPPGLPPLPPQNCGQSPEIRLTVLQNAKRGKVEDASMGRCKSLPYIEFIKTFVESTNIMSKSFFVVIPYDPPIIGASKNPIVNMFGSKKTSGEAAIAADALRSGCHGYRPGVVLGPAAVAEDSG